MAVPIDWNSNDIQTIFKKHGVTTFEQFYLIEDVISSSATIKVMRQHVNKKTGEINRQMVRVTIDDQHYYFKRTAGKYYGRVVDECKAIEVLPSFGFQPPYLVMSAFDEKNERAFFMLQDLKGFYSVADIIKGNASDTLIEQFSANKTVFLDTLAQRIRRIHNEGYFFLDWFGKHLFVREEDDTIALIDLERFLPIEQYPLYFRLPVVSKVMRQKAWRHLKKSLVSDMFSQDMLNNYLHD